MTWTKLDDTWDDSEKLAEAAEALADHGDSAYSMWSRAVTYCNRKLTDGVIAGAKLRGLTKHRRPQVVVDALVTAGAIVARGDGSFEVHDFLDWNDPREVVEARKVAKRVAASKGGKATQAGRQAESKDSSNGQARCLTPATTSGAPMEVHGHAIGAPLDKSSPLPLPLGSENQDPPKPPKGGGRGSKRRPTGEETSCPPSSAAESEVETWLASKNIPPVTERVWGDEVQTGLLDRCRAKGHTYIDWGAAWRTAAAFGVKHGRVAANPKRCMRSQIAEDAEKHRVAKASRQAEFVAPPELQARVGALFDGLGFGRATPERPGLLPVGETVEPSGFGE